VPNRRSRDDSPHREAAARLGRRLRQAREVRQLSQQHLATQASIAIGTVRSVESGRSVDPSFFTVLAMVDALEIRLIDLVSELRPLVGGNAENA
jgi:transcriptional regulator with XRE-family HTH domain